MKNHNGVSMLSRSYHSSETSRATSANSLGGHHRGAADLVNGNYSTTINVAHNKNNNRDDTLLYDIRKDLSHHTGWSICYDS